MKILEYGNKVAINTDSPFFDLVGLDKDFVESTIFEIQDAITIMGDVVIYRVEPYSVLVPDYLVVDVDDKLASKLIG